MLPELFKILYGDIDHVPRTRGRSMALLSGRETQVQTGSMADRILMFLSTESPARISEIARAVGSTPQKTIKTLRTLVTEGAVDEIDVEGCPVEYSLPHPHY